jgi:glycosyltransferase involved in cell wall biosynthesis
MRVALVYDRVNKWGGAERILLALHAIFPKAPLYTSVYNRKTAPWADVFTVHASFLQKIPLALRHHEVFFPLMPHAFEQFDFSNYDLVISVTSESAKGIVTKPQTKHICICLTPTRYLWSGYDEYFKKQHFKIMTKPLISYMRAWDTIAADRVDQFIAISKEVQTRIKKYYKRESIIVYPPVTLKTKEMSTFIPSQKNYFLVVSRLSRFTEYKHVDLAIKAANKLSLPLKIVGDGDIPYFKKMAGKTVEIVGRVSDADLISYYRYCRALIFPGKEDFGLVMVEAQNFGKPVIAFRAGGALEIIKEEKTGLFFDKQNVDALCTTLERFKKKSYNMLVCMENAQRFSFEKFKNNIHEIILQVIKKI